MLARKYWHKSITDELILEAAERGTLSLDNPGICLMCGVENDACEPDARNYVCEACGADAVFGAEELLMEVGL